MNSRLNNTAIIFLLLFLSLNIHAVVAQNPTFEGGPCYVIADSGDVFGKVNPDGSVTWIGSLVTDYGAGENLAIDPLTGSVYNIEGEMSIAPLIIIDPDTLGITVINEDTLLQDVDALAFNPYNELLYAVNKFQKFNDRPGILQLVDKDTGVATKIVDLYFDVAAPTTGVDPHIDGISFDPSNGVLYGIYSGYGGPSHLVTIDMSSGLITIIGDTGVEDIEDISFQWDGVLIGALGSQGLVEGSKFEGLVVIDKTSALASKFGVAYDDSKVGWDVEAVGCTVIKVDKPVTVGGSLLPADSFTLINAEILFYLTVIIMLISVILYKK